MDSPSAHHARLAPAALAAAFATLSLGSTIAKSVDAPGPVVAFWRLAIGALAWWAVVLHRRHRSVAESRNARRLRLAIVPGVLFGVNLSLFFSGVRLTPVAHAEFINAMAPIVTVPVAALVLRERMRRDLAVAGAFALAGIGLVLAGRGAGRTSIGGDLLVGGAMLAWVAYLITSKRARAALGTAEFMAVMSASACITTLPVALITAGGLPAFVDLGGRGWLLVAVLGLTAAVAAHGLIAWAQPRVPATMVTVVQLVQPGLGAIWAATFLGEHVSATQVVGMAVVLAAVATVIRPRSPLARPRRRRRQDALAGSRLPQGAAGKLLR